MDKLFWIAIGWTMALLMSVFGYMVWTLGLAVAEALQALGK